MTSTLPGDAGVSGAEPPPWDDLEPSPEPPSEFPQRYQWERAFREAQPGVRPGFVGLALATYASRDGSSIKPGFGGLAKRLGVSDSYLRNGRDDLLRSGWLMRVSKGKGVGNSSAPDEFRLTLPAMGVYRDTGDPLPQDRRPSTAARETLYRSTALTESDTSSDTESPTKSSGSWDRNDAAVSPPSFYDEDDEVGQHHGGDEQDFLTEERTETRAERFDRQRAERQARRKSPERYVSKFGHPDL